MKGIVSLEFGQGAAEELVLSYHFEETLFFTIDPYYGNLASLTATQLKLQHMRPAFGTLTGSRVDSGSERPMSRFNV